MKVYVVTEVAKPFYYAPLEKLKQKGEIEDWELWSFRTFRPALKNTLIKLGLVEGREYEPLNLKEFFMRLFLPLRMLFWDNIIFGMEPFDVKVIYPLIMKFLGKNIVEYTSWPYWEGNFQPRTGVPGVRLLWRLFLRNLRVVAVTPAAKKAVEGFEPAAKVAQIPHSVDLEKFKPRGLKGETLGVKKRMTVITLVQLYPEKGIRQIIELAKRIPEADFVVVSRGGTMEEEVGKAEEKLKNFKWVGDKGREKKLREADIFVLASYRIPRWEELFGMAVVEAMASGLPVVATDSVGPRGIVEEGKTGFIVPQKDTDALEGKIRLLLGDSELRRRMGERSHEVAKRKYNIGGITEKWLRVITA
ncbi:MAG: hypothetical protein BMS9Abin34_433 [Patescibacteria group bacterium]|nr:MAG: hypothetical protein BMS9Abin34_433 [Patescibacteria group bacterium]